MTHPSQLSDILTMLCSIVESCRDISGGLCKSKGFHRAVLHGGSGPWKVTGLDLARAYTQHGAERFGGVPDDVAADMLLILRRTATSLYDHPAANPTDLLNSVVASVMPGVQSHQLALGLADADTEYSGNLMLVLFPDLMKANVCSQTGRINLIVDGDPQALEARFDGLPLSEHVHAHGEAVQRIEERLSRTKT